MDAYIPVLVAFIGGGLITAVTNYLLGKKKNDLDGFKILEDSWIKKFSQLDQDIEKIRLSEAECTSKYKELDHKYEMLKAAFQVHKKSSPELPIPMWIKDMNGIMLALNDAYEKAFLFPLNKTREDYVGNTDDEVWGSDIANEFKRNDKKVKETGNTVRVFEKVQSAPDVFENFDILKYPKMDGEIIIAVGGIALPKSTIYS